MIEDNTKSNPLRNIPKEQRIDEVKKNYFNIDIKVHKDLLLAYASMCLSLEEYMFKIQQEKLFELIMHMRGITLKGKDSVDQTVKILEKLDKMWEGLEKTRSRMNEAESKLKTRGDIKESHREKRSR